MPVIPFPQSSATLSPFSPLFPQRSRTLTASSPALPEYLDQPVLVPTRLAGVDGLCSLFEYRVQLKTPEASIYAADRAANIPLQPMLGKAITLNIELDGKGHFISGALLGEGEGSAGLGRGVREISALIFESAYLGPAGQHHVYELTLRPWLWLATLNRTSRVFQDKTVLEILDTVLADYAFPLEKRLLSKYPPRDYVVQYNEPDYTFFARLCEEWGICWWFEHSEGAHRLVLGDAPSAFRANPNAAYQAVNFYPPGHKVDEEYLSALSASFALTPGTYVSGDEDYTQAGADLTARAHAPRESVNTPAHATAEVFHWANDAAQPLAGARGLAGTPNDPIAEGERHARTRLAALQAPGERAYAGGNLRGMCTGATFRLNKHPQQAANIEWLPLETRLEIQEVDLESLPGPASAAGALGALGALGTLGTLGAAGAAGQGGLSPNTAPVRPEPVEGLAAWRCRVELILQPAALPLRPPLRHRKPRMEGIMTATVTGPRGATASGSDKEIWTDAYGRVKIVFPWERDNPRRTADQGSSCWVRVATAWAGSQYGAIHIPRVGQEVLIAFENADPDRPIITGRMTNNLNLPPWQLPDNQALSGFRSKELYGSQHNHLIMDDTEGGIQTQISSDHALSQLNLGQVVRVPDNSGRADPRGEGFELRTDAHGVVRAKDGLLITTEARNNARGHIKSMDETTARLDAAAEAHAQRAHLARQHLAQEGQHDEVARAIKAQNDALKGSGKVAGNVPGNANGTAKPEATPESGHFPEFAEPHLTLASPAGIETTTAGSTHLASGEHIAVTTGNNLSIASRGSLFASIRNGLRWFTYETGMRLVAVSNNLEFTAVRGNLDMMAKLKITETAETIDLSAETEIVINGGGSTTTFNAQGIVHSTAGAYTIHRAGNTQPPGSYEAVEPMELPEARPELRRGFSS